MGWPDPSMDKLSFNREKYSKKRKIYCGFKQKPFKFIEISLLLVPLVVVLLLFERHILGWREWAQWTGFGEYIGDLPFNDRGKTLWDWMELLIIPGILGLSAIWFNLRTNHEEKERVLDQQREDALNKHIDFLSNSLTFSDNLDFPPELKVIINIKTKLVLSALDGVRKGILIKFLHNSYLLGKGDFIIDLEDANLEEVNLDFTELFEVNLSKGLLNKASLKHAFLRSAKFNSAILSDADLEGAQLRSADLELSFLRRANLQWVIMDYANLENADLTNANLRNAYISESKLNGSILTGANFSNANLFGVKLKNAEWDNVNFSNAMMPDGKKYDSNFHTKEYLTSTDFTEQ